MSTRRLATVASPVIARRSRPRRNGIARGAAARQGLRRLALPAVYLGCLVAACSTPPRVATVQDHSPSIPPQPVPVLGRPTSNVPPAAVPSAPPRDATLPPPPRTGATAGMTPPVNVAGVSNELARGNPVSPGGGPNAAAATGAGAAASAATLDWSWPVDTPISAPFSDASKGIDFSGAPGQAVRAAAAGVVAYIGDALKQYGRMVVIRHDKGYLSVYGQNRQVLVKEGDHVLRGQKIAEMGSTVGSAGVLHFELRRQGRPLDPAQILPAR